MTSSAIHAAQNLGTEADWCAFFTQFHAFDKQRSAQQQAGVNDYSLLASVLKVNDEVRLHSRFLFSLLDPEGSHHQKGVFGERFLSQIGYANWLDWSKTKAHRERKSIDLYLSDGKRHVIVENKLNAPDQKRQIQRYVDAIRADTEADAEDVLVIYLTKGRPHPGETSLGDYRILTDQVSRSHIVDSQDKRLACYINMHYGAHVLPWIDDCLLAAGNIDNLRYALLEYKTIVERATRTYKSRVMNLETFLSASTEDLSRQARIRYAFEIAEKLPVIKAGWLTEMFTDGLDSMLEPYVRNGQLIPITDVDSETLKPFQFAPRHAFNFFDASKILDNKNKGRFWRLRVKDNADQQALAVFFGKSMLHIGVLPIMVEDGKETQSKSKFSISTDRGNLVFEQHVPVNKVLNGLVSWVSPLHQDIEQLAMFDSSLHKVAIEVLLQKLLSEPI